MTVTVTLLTFGGGEARYRRAAARLGRAARDSGRFAAVHVVTDALLRRDHPEFVAAHAEMLRTGVRGYGYWIWKPYLLAHVLATADTDVVLYVDAGCELHLSTAAARERLDEYFAMARDTGIFVMREPGLQESA